MPATSRSTICTLLKSSLIACLVLAGPLAHPSRGQTPAVKATSRPSLPPEPYEKAISQSSYALFVGVNQFRDQEFPELEYAVNDAVAQAFAVVVELRLIAPANCTLLLAGEPTAQLQPHLKKLRELGVSVDQADPEQRATLAAFNASFQKLKSRKLADLIVISLSSHGFLIGGEAYVVAHDSQRDRLRESAIQLSKVEEDLQSTEANHRLVLVDACQERITSRSITDGAQLKKSAAAFQAALKKPSGQIRVVSCSPGKLAQEHRGSGHGAFTATFLEALRTVRPQRNDGVVDLQCVLNAAKDALKQKHDQVMFTAGDLAAGEIPLAYRPNEDAAGMLNDLDRRKSEGEGKFTADHLDRVREVLENFNASDVRAHEILTLARDYRANRITEPQFVHALDTSRRPAAMVNSVGMAFHWIPGRTFVMGLKPGEPVLHKNNTPHRVTITKSFLAGETEVTQAQFARVMGRNPSSFAKTGTQARQVTGLNTDDFPVESVSWHEAMEFVKKLSELPEEVRAGRIYDLPTEAEWELAAADGGDETFGNRPTLSGDQANFDSTKPQPGTFPVKRLGRPCPVASYPAGKLGLFDVFGNVDEWTRDAYVAEYEILPRYNPFIANGEQRAVRGGGWKNNWQEVRRAARWSFAQNNREDNLGFRVICRNCPGLEPPAAERATLTDPDDSTAPSLLQYSEDFTEGTRQTPPVDWSCSPNAFRIDRYQSFPFLTPNPGQPRGVGSIGLPARAIELLTGDFVMEVDFWMSNSSARDPRFAVQFDAGKKTLAVGTWIDRSSIWLKTSQTPNAPVHNPTDNWTFYVSRTRPYPATLRIQRKGKDVRSSLLKLTSHLEGFAIHAQFPGKLTSVELLMQEADNNSAIVSAVRVFVKDTPVTESTKP